VQESIDQITVKIAPGLGFNADTARTIENRLRTRMGGAAITMQVVDEVERTKNGKIQAVVCRLSAEEREAILSGARGQSPVALSRS
jgi:acyl-coenzyme A synthetase/AMP-(fatty) acid ligase